MLLIMVSSLPSEEEEFFLEIYQKYYPYAKKYMMSKLKNQSELEDAIQMAFIALIPKVKLLKSFNEYKLNYYRNPINYCTYPHARNHPIQSDM